MERQIPFLVGFQEIIDSMFSTLVSPPLFSVCVCVCKQVEKKGEERGEEDRGGIGEEWMGVYV